MLRMRLWPKNLFGVVRQFEVLEFGQSSHRRALSLLPAIAVISSSAMATSEYNKSIAHVGTQGSTAYVIFTVAPSAGCNYSDIYLDLTTDAGKASYSLLITAYSSSRPISRVDYTKATDGTCTLDLVEM